MTDFPAELIEYDKLSKHPANPRQGDVKAIKESIALNGWHGVVVAQDSTGRLLVGNHRWEAAVDIWLNGWSSEDGSDVVQPGDAGAIGLTMRNDKLLIPAHLRDVDDDVALRILLMDNRAGDLATYDEPQLLQLLVQIEQGGVLKGLDPAEAMAGTGYTPADAEQLSAGLTVAPVDPWNNTPEHNLERYLATDLRQITVIMEAVEYKPVIEVMLAIQEREKMETNKDVFLHLLRLDPAGGELDARIAEARADAESAATANGDAQEGTEGGADGSEGTPAGGGA